jgi:TPR repeat protein
MPETPPPNVEQTGNASLAPAPGDADSLDTLGARQLAYHDRAGALESFRKASRLQNTHSMVMLGAMSSEDGNYSDAAEMFREAADLDNPRGMYNLGVLYETGKGVAYSLENAAHWYGLAEKLGDTDATYRLGTMYEQGAGGMPRDLQKARDLYQRAGTPDATKRLAVISPQVP